MKTRLLLFLTFLTGDFCLFAQCNFTGLNSTYSTCDQAATLTGNPVGGAFSGPGMIGNTFNPSTAGTGVHTINYFGAYSVSQTGTFSPLTQSSPTFLTLGDDQLSSALPIGFTFLFYGNSYTNFYISSNGFISFDAAAGSGCCSGQFLPDVNQPNNIIACAWEDLYPPVGGTISYSTIGTAPNRILIVNFSNIQHFSSGNPVTSQILLYEGTNIIDIHTTAMPSDGGSHTMGIENASGTLATIVPGRNSSSWSVSNDFVRFLPCQFSQTVTVTNDLTAPVMNGVSSNISVNAAPGNCNAVVSFTTPTATDNCSIACGNAPLTDVFSNFTTNSATITGAIPNPYNFSLDLGATATYISDGGNDMYDGGNFLNTNLSNSIPYTNGVINASPAFGSGGQYFTTKVNNMFVMAADVNGVSSFFISGDNGADGSGSVDGFNYTVNVGCLSFDVFVKRVYNAFDPSINQIIIVPSGIGANHTFSLNSNLGEHTVNGIGSATRIYYLLVGGNNGYFYTNAEIQNIVSNFLNLSGTVINLQANVTVNQTAGLPSGSAFPIGTTIVTFQATDGAGNTASQSFNVTVSDNDAPVPNIASLAPITSGCQVSSLTAPTATDLCAGTITGTHNAILPISGQGTTVITWTYDDGNGNTTTQTQNVVIDDVTAPVPNISQLANVTGECAVNNLIAPTALDNCAGTVTGTHNAALPITAPGTTIVTWSFDDGNGNISTQTQNVIIADTEAPVPTSAILPIVTSECEIVSLTEPSAVDNCSAVTVTNNATLPINTQGNTVVTWTYTDAAGNFSTQTQSIVIQDLSGPTPVVASLPNVEATCEVTVLNVPTASDNCSGPVAVSSDAVLPILADQTITWTYTDENGNTSTQTQQITIIPVDASVSVSGTTITANNTNSNSTYQWIDCDNGNSPITGATASSYTPTTTGNYAVEVTEGSCTEVSECTLIDFSGLTQLSSTFIHVYPNPASSMLNIETSVEGTLDFYDVSGKLILTRNVHSGTNELNVRTLATGTYTVRLTTLDGVNVVRVVIDRQ